MRKSSLAKRAAAILAQSAPESDQRAPVDEQPIALAEAEEAGTLPAIDRRDPLSTLPVGTVVLVSAKGIEVKIPRGPHTDHGVGPTLAAALASIG